MRNESKTTNNIIESLETALKKGKLTKNEYIRIHAVFLKHKGYTHKEISKITLKGQDALEKWITAFNKYGIQGLKNKPLNKPRNYKLTYEQKNKIKEIINKNNPEKLGFKAEFWTPILLKQLVKNQFNIAYKSKKAYHELLDYCGFSYQKVEYKDSREDKAYKEDMKLRLKKKLKKGVLKMYW